MHLPSFQLPSIAYQLSNDCILWVPIWLDLCESLKFNVQPSSIKAAAGYHTLFWPSIRVAFALVFITVPLVSVHIWGHNLLTHAQSSTIVHHSCSYKWHSMCVNNRSWLPFADRRCLLFTDFTLHIGFLILFFRNRRAKNLRFWTATIPECTSPAPVDPRMYADGSDNMRDRQTQPA